jgi:F-type H+-transporting ATPase subunit c
MGVGLGLGIIGYGAMGGMSRQPEAIGKLQTAMLIAMAFVELVGLLTIFLLPGFMATAEVKIAGGAPAAIEADAEAH